MKQTHAQLEQRCRHLRARIAAQRMLFGQQLEALRGPAIAFDKARAVGMVVRQNAPLLALGGSVLMFLARGRLVSSVVGGVRLGRRVMKMMTLWKIATAFLRRHPGRPYWQKSALV
jgi:hypothetical protein